jgi:hypothetical protein
MAAWIMALTIKVAQHTLHAARLCAGKKIKRIKTTHPFVAHMPVALHHFFKV